MSEEIDKVLTGVNKVKDKRNLFIHGLWTKPFIKDKIRALLKSIKQTPFKGLGKLEPLKHNLKGFWSRRITGEHRLVYHVSGAKGQDQKYSIIQCKFHYDK